VPQAAAKPRESYWRISRSFAASIVFVVPLFALYQLGLLFDARVQTGTDSALRAWFAEFPYPGMLVVNVVVLGLLVFAIHRSRQRRTARLYGGMLLEACGWTALLRLVQIFFVPWLLARVLALPYVPRRAIGFVGAGIYEEVLFRFLLLGGLVYLLHRWIGVARKAAVPAAILASAAVFSWAHHALGGEPFTWNVFVYRGLMGAALGWIYWERGLGIVVYAHALYNVSLLIPVHA
jgi:hypothetical protein